MAILLGKAAKGTTTQSTSGSFERDHRGSHRGRHGDCLLKFAASDGNLRGGLDADPHSTSFDLLHDNSHVVANLNLLFQFAGEYEHWSSFMKVVNIQLLQEQYGCVWTPQVTQKFNSETILKILVS